MYCKCYLKHLLLKSRGGRKEVMADKELRQRFSERLNYYLNLNKYTQADMARRMHVSTATTAKWCTGVSIPRIDKIQSLCNWLGIEKSQLLDSGEEESQEEYYINKDARDLAEFLFKNPEYRVLFDASRNVKPEDIEFVKQMIDRMSGKGED